MALVFMLVAFAVSCGGSGEGSDSGSSGSGGSGSGGDETSVLATQERSGTTSEDSGARVEVTTLVKNLEAPWGLDFLPGGDALVTERDSGRVLRVSPEGEVSEVQTIEAGGSGEGGLLGLAVSPDYRQDGYVYVYYTTDEDNRIARFRLGEKPEPIFTGIPAGSIHNGGRIAFGPDGMLYAGAGETGERGLAQERDTLGGKILRLTPDGDVPEDNPFSDNPVYSYGHRNVQGLTWDKGGQLYATEFGQDTYDEVNRIEAGENYGWPEVEGEGGEPEYVDPISTWSTDEASPSGATFLKNGAIPQWEGDFFMAALGGHRLWRLQIEDGEVTDRRQMLREDYGRLRDVDQAPDGSLWVLTSNRGGRGSPREGDDRILRIGPPESR